MHPVSPRSVIEAVILLESDSDREGAKCALIVQLVTAGDRLAENQG